MLFLCRAIYIKKKLNGKRLSSNTYLTEAEPFLKKFAERSLKNKKLVGAAGVDIDVSDFLALQHIDEDEYVSEGEHAPTAPAQPAPTVRAQGMLVFFPGTHHGSCVLSLFVLFLEENEIGKQFNSLFLIL